MLVEDVSASQFAILDMVAIEEVNGAPTQMNSDIISHALLWEIYELFIVCVRVCVGRFWGTL